LDCVVVLLAYFCFQVSSNFFFPSLGLRSSLLQLVPGSSVLPVSGARDFASEQENVSFESFLDPPFCSVLLNVPPPFTKREPSCPSQRHSFRLRIDQAGTEGAPFSFLVLDGETRTPTFKAPRPFVSLLISRPSTGPSESALFPLPYSESFPPNVTSSRYPTLFRFASPTTVRAQQQWKGLSRVISIRGD